jgi:RNA polymerase sigma-70 factor (ECF subfamily)
MEDSRESLAERDGSARQGSPLPPEEVARLVRLAKEGSREAFGRILEAFRLAIVSLAYQVTGSREDAEDVAQETFLRAFRHIAEYREESKFFSWLYRIAVNAALDRVRRGRVVPTALREDLSLWVDDEEDEAARDRRVMIWMALDRLPPDQRAALVLRELHGLSYVEIGRILGITPGAVGWRIRAARQYLQRALRGAV